MALHLKDFILFFLLGAIIFFLPVAIVEGQISTDWAPFFELFNFGRPLYVLGGFTGGCVPWIVLFVLIVSDGIERRWAKTAAAFCGYSLAFYWLASFGCLDSLSDVLPRRITFNSAQWVDSVSSGRNAWIRFQMVGDLLDRENLKGLTRKQVDSMLGAPLEAESSGDSEYRYWLAPYRNYFQPQPFLLGIRFRNGKVSDLWLGSG